MIKFDDRLSLGNVITIGTLLVGLVVGWTQLGQGIDVNATGIRKVEVRVTALESNFNTLLRDLGAERVAQTRVLTEVQTDLRYLRQAVDQLAKP